jgi:hypothetical protein
MQKPRPKEATAPRQQRPDRENRGSHEGASAPFSVSKGENAPNQPQNPTPSVSEPAAKTAGTDPGAGVIRNEASSRPESWEAIRVGSLVIAHESPEDGWWEAIVVAVENDQLLLRWRDYPRQPCVRRGRLGVALLPPVAA